MENIQDIIERIHHVVNTHKLADGSYTRWLWQNEAGTRELGENPYGCADAANILYSIGAFPSEPEERKAWIETLRNMQSPETGMYVEATHHTIHTTAHCMAALELFDAAPKYPVTALHPYLPESTLEDFLDQLLWDEPWDQSHKGAGIYVAMNLTGTATPEWNRRYFQWLWDNADPETGLWRKGEPLKLNPKKPIYHHMASTFHYLFNHEYAHMPLRYPEKLIDICIEMYDNGELSDMHDRMAIVAGFLEIDWVFCMTRASRQTPHRFYEVRDRLRNFAARYIAFFRNADWEINDSLNDLHALFGATCCLAELQQTLRGELISNKPMKLVLDRRPFI